MQDSPPPRDSQGPVSLDYTICQGRGSSEEGGAVATARRSVVGGPWPLCCIWDTPRVSRREGPGRRESRSLSAWDPQGPCPTSQAQEPCRGLAGPLLSGLLSLDPTLPPSHTALASWVGWGFPGLPLQGPSPMPLMRGGLPWLSHVGGRITALLCPLPLEYCFTPCLPRWPVGLRGSG